MVSKLLDKLMTTIEARRRQQDFDLNGRANEYDKGYNDALDTVLAMMSVLTETIRKEGL